MHTAITHVFCDRNRNVIDSTIGDRRPTQHRVSGGINAPRRALRRASAAQAQAKIAAGPAAALFDPGIEVLWKEQDSRRCQSDQPTVFSGAYIITALQCVYTWLTLQFCGRSGPTGTFGNAVPPTKP